MDQAVERLTAHEEVVKNLNDGSTRIKEAAEQLTALRDTFTLSAQRNKEAAQAQEKAAATNEDVAARFEVVGDKLPEVQLAIADGARVIGTLGQPLMDLRELLERTRAIFGEQAEAQSSRDEQRTRVLLAQTETLAKAVADAAAKFAQVESLAVSLEGAAANLQQASNSLGDLGESIQHASRRHEEAASHSERAALAGERAAEKLAPIPDSLETAGRTLTDAGDQIKDGATAARDAYGQLLMHQEEWFRGIKIGLVAMKDQVQSILDTYGSSVEQETQRQMRQWIDAVDESLRKFSTQIQALEGLVSDLSSTNNR
jgi:chromosome segregation ATPase